jgi:hypothetical protein
MDQEKKWKDHWRIALKVLFRSGSEIRSFLNGGRREKNKRTSKKSQEMEDYVL